MTVHKVSKISFTVQKFKLKNDKNRQIIPPSIGNAYGLAVNALRAVSISELGIADASLGALSHENQGLIMWKLGSDIDAVRYKIGSKLLIFQ